MITLRDKVVGLSKSCGDRIEQLTKQMSSMEDKTDVYHHYCFDQGHKEALEAIKQLLDAFLEEEECQSTNIDVNNADQNKNLSPASAIPIQPVPSADKK